MKTCTRPTVDIVPRSSFALLGLIALGFSAGCTPTCTETCRKLLRCDEELGIVEYGITECEESCNRTNDLYESWEDQDKIDAFAAHKQCIAGATCDEINDGVCYDEDLYVFP